jgi:acetyltransferase-like isoleucine patch superfamily enzyme
MKSVIILGVSNLARELRHWIEDTGITVKAFVEPITNISNLDGLPVYRDFDLVKECGFISTELRSEFKEIQSNMAKASGLNPADPIIHPTATISNEVILEKDVVICPNCVISPYSVISEGSIVLPNSYIRVENTTNRFSIK